MNEPPVATEPTNPAPDRPSGEVSLSEPLLLHYLFAVCSLGSYLVFRGYRVARRLDEGARVSRAHAVAWACAVLCAPAACAYLYEAARLARARTETLGGRVIKRPLALPPLLFLGIGFALLASRLSALWTPLLLLLPIPFVLLQADLNRLETARLAQSAAAPGPRTGAAPRWLAVGLLPLTVLGLWWLDHQAAKSIRTARRLSADMVVANERGLFSLRIPSTGWEQVGPGVLGDGSEALGFQKQRNEIWVVVYIQSTAGTLLDDAVAFRRGLIQTDNGVLSKIDERRYFLEGANLVPASFARYRMRYPKAIGIYEVLTTTVADNVVEVVGFASPEFEEDVGKFVRSLRMAVQP